MGKLIYDTNTLLKEYKEKIKGDFPGITDDQISEICKYQFLLVRKEIEMGTLRTVRIKYFGSFRVFKGRVLGIRNRMKRLYEAGRMKHENFQEIAEMCDNYLEQNKEETNQDEDDDEN